MRAKSILLLLPALACARISVHIETPTAKNEPSVIFKGGDSNIISGIEIDSFNITPSNLKTAVNAHAGGTPLDVFVKSPTPWGDLYKTYNWSEVRRDTQVREAKITNVITDTVVLYKQSYNNKLKDSDIVCDADVNTHVDNYVKNNYTGKLISVDADYNIKLVIVPHLEMPLKLVSHLGVNSFVKESMRIQVHEKFTLKPSQTVELILNATKVSMDVVINYESDLNGDVTANFYPRHKGHHFWAYDVKAIIRSVGNMSAVQKGTDIVTIECFTDAYGYVIDQSTGKLIAKFSAVYVF